MKQSKAYFWVTNISDRNVSLTDLNLTIYSKRSVNLLDNKHYDFKKEQLLNSAESGSIFKKRDKIVVRKVPPVIESDFKIDIQLDATIPTNKRSSVEIEEIIYEELALKDEEFAEENSDTADADHLGKWNK